MNTSVTTVTVPTPQMRAHAPRDDALWMTPLELVMPSFTNECSVTPASARTDREFGWKETRIVPDACRYQFSDIRGQAAASS